MRVLHKAGLIVLAAALVAPTALEAAQARAVPRDQGWSRAAHDEGYRRGVRAGEDHGRRGQPFNFSIVLDFRQGDYGYRPDYGPRDRYRSEFRLGFEEGYRQAYGQYDVRRGYPGRGGPPPGYGRSRGNEQFALSNGYEDGYKEGLNDGRRHHRNDPYAESRYRGATHGYQGWFGPKEYYKIPYRDGFIQGYERGYRDGWYRRNW